MLLSRFMVGSDGMTGYERRRGRKCTIAVVPFGEAVWYREVRVTKERKNMYDTEWKDGIWLGHTRRSNEVVVGTADGVVRAYSIKRRAEGERWNGELLKSMRGSP